MRNHEEIYLAHAFHGLSMSVEDIHSYFPEAASAGLWFIKSFGDAKNSHLLKFHWRFQADRQLKGQFVEASNPASASFVYCRSAFSLNATIYHELRGFALRAGTSPSGRWTLSKNCYPALFERSSVAPLRKKKAAGVRARWNTRVTCLR